MAVLIEWPIKAKSTHSASHRTQSRIIWQIEPKNPSNQRRENVSKQVTSGLTKWREILQPITKHSNSKL